MKWTALAVVLLSAACGKDAALDDAKRDTRDTEPDAGDVADSGTSVEDSGAGAAYADAGVSDSGPDCAQPGRSEPDVEMQRIQFEHPAPGGQYDVGTHIAWYLDKNREEPSSAEDEHRGVGVQFFYPTDVAEGEFGPLMSDAVAAEIVKSRRYPANTHNAVRTRSRFDVPISTAQESWPVLVYSHGLATFPQENQMLFEEFASQGWIVVALSHTFSATATQLPDGRVAVSRNTPPAPMDGDLEGGIEWISSLSELLQGTWVKDVEFVLDTLEELNDEECHWLSGKLNLDALGMLGYSFGGATAFEVCRIDERCRAAIDLDGRLYGDVRQPSDKPLMYIRSDSSGGDHAWDLLRQGHAGPSYSLWLFGANHGHYTQNYIMLENFVGPAPRDWMDPLLGFQIYRDYSLAFMNAYVLEQMDRTLTGRPLYPGVMIERAVDGISDGPALMFGKVALGLDYENYVPDAWLELPDLPQLPILSGEPWIVSDIAPNETVPLRFGHPDGMDLLFTVPTEQRFKNLRSVRVMPLESMNVMAEQADIVLDETKGHIWFEATAYHQDKALGGAPGVEFHAEGAEIVVYDSVELELEPSLTSTAGAGRAFAFNLEPGTITISVDHAMWPCGDLNLSSPPNGRLDVTVEADAVAYVSVRCETD